MLAAKKDSRRIASIKKCERIEQLNWSDYIKRRQGKIAKYQKITLQHTHFLINS